MNTEVAKDLITLVNSLKGLQKTKKVKYSVKDKNGEYKQLDYHYVPLDDLLEVVKKNEKFTLMQPISEFNGTPCIENVLIHESGEEIRSGQYPLLISGLKMQDMGSVITYTRRYSMSAFLGISTDDDVDANLEEEAEDVKATPKQVKILLENYKDDNLKKLLETNKITKIEDIPLKKASELIGKLFDREGKK